MPTGNQMLQAYDSPPENYIVVSCAVEFLEASTVLQLLTLWDKYIPETAPSSLLIHVRGV